MKKQILFLLLLGFSLGIQAQNCNNNNNDDSNIRIVTVEKVETYRVRHQGTHHGFYIAPVVKVSQFDGETVLVPGLQAAWIINRSVALGIAGYGLVPTVVRDDINPNTRVRPLSGYGGLLVEPIILSNNLVHLTIPMVFGAGWFGYVEDWSSNNNDFFSDDLIEEQIIWVIEPGIGLEFNVAPFFRLHAGYSYRATQNLELENTSGAAFRGSNYALTLKFGRF